jgi:phage head maturation protease
MTDANLDHLRQDALLKRINGIAGGLRICWSSRDIARLTDHVRSAPANMFLRDVPSVARKPAGSSIAAARRKFSESIVVRNIQPDDLNFAFIISSQSVDLAGDVIIPAGIDCSDFRRNSVVLNSHNSSTMPIAVSTSPVVAGATLTAVAKFPAPGISEASDQVAAALKAGLIRAASIGFQPTRWTFSKDPARPFGVDFQEIRLLEWSICSVPCNPDCLLIGAVGGKSAKLVDRTRVRSGRSISRANEELLREAMDHHASATECVKEVLDSNEAAEPDADGTGPGDPPNDGKSAKSGRRISAANEALLRDAMDHHASATKCIKDVLDEAAELEPDTDGTGPGDPPNDGKRLAERQCEARALVARARSLASSTSDAPALTREQRVAEARNFRAAMDAWGK